MIFIDFVLLYIDLVIDKSCLKRKTNYNHSSLYIFNLMPANGSNLVTLKISVYRVLKFIKMNNLMNLLYSIKPIKVIIIAALSTWTFGIG